MLTPFGVGGLTGGGGGGGGATVGGEGRGGGGGGGGVEETTGGLVGVTGEGLCGGLVTTVLSTSVMVIVFTQASTPLPLSTCEKPSSHSPDAALLLI